MLKFLSPIRKSTIRFCKHGIQGSKNVTKVEKFFVYIYNISGIKEWVIKILTFTFSL